MATQTPSRVNVPPDLIEAVRTFPHERIVEHCGVKIVASPFDFYATCPHCGTRIKLRAFSAGSEVEDIFDAVFEWMNQPGAAELARHRQQAIEADRDE
jgi:hypothetical protein